MNSYELVSARLADLVGKVDSLASAGSDEQAKWEALWLAASDALRRQVENGNLAAFEAAFPLVSDALRACDARGRAAAMPRVFGDFTRSAIAAGIDRTRFVDWFGAPEILEAAVGRTRGRVLYFNDDKGHGRILATDRTVSHRDGCKRELTALCLRAERGTLGLACPSGARATSCAVQGNLQRSYALPLE